MLLLGAKGDTRMRLGIDASNIRAGGGVTYLSEMLDAADPPSHGIEEVYVWSNARTLASLPTKSWLRPMHHRSLDRGLIRRSMWRARSLTKSLNELDCDVLFAVGGIYTGTFEPVVVLSQNLLPFEEGERQRYGKTLARLRIELIRCMQARTCASASVLIFNTHTARRMIEDQVKGIGGVVAVIPFGVHRRFALEPRRQKSLEEFSFDRPFRWLYVSTVDVYKHHPNVVAAVGRLRHEGLPVVVDFIGGGYRPALSQLMASIAELDPRQEFVRYLGPIPPQDLAGYYHQADALVFASTCESPSFVILEAMAAGLPIACARRSALPEVVGEGGAQFFDPEDPGSIAAAMRVMLNAPDLRAESADSVFARARQLTWEHCAGETMRLIAEVGTGATGAATKSHS